MLPPATRATRVRSPLKDEPESPPNCGPFLILFLETFGPKASRRKYIFPVSFSRRAITMSLPKGIMYGHRFRRVMGMKKACFLLEAYGWTQGVATSEALLSGSGAYVSGCGSKFSLTLS